MMKLRVARHTTELAKIISFYKEIFGLEQLGSFNDHDHYDGVFLGLPGENWHLEFTVSDEKPDHKPDDDDLLVFYVKTEKEYQNILEKARLLHTLEVPAKNPYWHTNGITLLDPDGYRVVISIDPVK